MAISETEVSFLVEPRVGERADFMRQGQKHSSSPVINVWRDNEVPAKFHVQTSSGSRYSGALLTATTAFPAQTYSMPAHRPLEPQSVPIATAEPPLWVAIILGVFFPLPALIGGLIVYCIVAQPGLRNFGMNLMIWGGSCLVGWFVIGITIHLALAALVFH